MPVSFRTRLTAWYMLMLAALLIAVAAALITTMQRLSQHKLDARLWIVGATEAEGIAARLRDRNIKSPDELSIHDIDYRKLPAYNRFQVQKYVTVIDARRRVADFSRSSLETPLPLKEDLISQAFRGEVVYDTTEVSGIGELRLIYVPVTDSQTEPFIVIVGMPTNFIGAEVGILTGRVLLIIIPGLALTALSGWLLARRALRPIVETTALVERITDRNLNERLPEWNAKDEIGRLIAVFNDLLARLNNSFVAQGRAIEAQRRFTADASHEINTPLTVLKADTQLALQRHRTPEEYERLLQSNLEEIERLSRLTANLLLLARADAGEQGMRRVLLILNELVTDVCARFKAIAGEQNIALEISSPEFILVRGDRLALEEIIFNLVSNALRYTPRGGHVQLRIERAAEGWARLEVADTGIGISPEALPHIFNRFYRAGNARAYESNGSGLGLSICQIIAQAHGGYLTVVSTLNAGSRFIVILPAA